MAKLIMLIGLPAAGKTTYARSLLDTIGLTKVVSLEQSRKELYGVDRLIGDPNKVYSYTLKKIKQYLKEGYDVVYDAYNVKRKTRKHIINEVKNISSSVEGHIIWAPYEECLTRDKQRARVTGKSKITELLYKWQSPHKDEGFDVLDIIYNCNVGWNRLHYTNCLLDNMNISQDNPHHRLSIKEHCADAEAYCYNRYPEISILKLAAAYHDIGKPMTKAFKCDETGKILPTAYYYQHDNVGGYLVYGCFPSEAVSKERALLVSWLVCYHMHPYFQSDYYKQLKGTSKMWLDMLHEADVAAH